MNHQIGFFLRGMFGHMAKWPLAFIIAILDDGSLQPAAGVPEQHDMPWVSNWNRQVQAAGTDMSGARGYRRDADSDRERLARRCALNHWPRFAVGDQGWAYPVVRHQPRLDHALLAIL